jgi:hypothetical protein
MSLRASMRDRFDYLLSLRRGWLDGEGEPVPLAVAAWVDRWISESSDDELHGWHLYPLELGGVRFERTLQTWARLVDDSVDVRAGSIALHRYVRTTSQTGVQMQWSGYFEFDLLTHEPIELDVDPLE